MGLFDSYSIWNYGEMISDHVRMAAYDQALRAHVDSDSVVLDIGTGTGVFAVLACRYGARRVFAIEPSVALQVAREVACDNGVADRIEFFNDVSTNVRLPEPATVIISDLRSVLPLFQYHCRTIVDARQRLLAPNGTLIPRQDSLWVALVSGGELYRHIVGPYRDNRFNLNMEAADRFVTNEWRRGSKLQQEELFLAPQCWTKLDYYSWVNPNLAGELEWEVTEPGTVNGFCIWFDAELADGIGFSNAPGKETLIYGRAFFPWTRPIELSVGDRVTLRITAKLVGDEYVWSWDTRADSADDRRVLARFQQSTFLRAPRSLAELRRRTSDHVPRLSFEGRLQQVILEAMDGEATLEEIASQVAARFSDKFESWQDAYHRVAELSQRFSE